ncbi:hypothetical protein QBC33DRAFT_564600 [Phialemonium atrogriseum]|uniref:Protein kinase domain-containing protein n=1 Tax=Phialemonium atrogriseum TaxID=1093897 RepID=A0AAJ0C9N0_9PEZI|nr:uncharacterized protein QBC33DRAFT_564600 [Phialemonium atrogriseum]KAK1772097.1 hypothetical protein QBC33DRAFT_564600 [Phialemonium atrogriseum]
MVFVKFGHSHEQAEGDMQRLAFDWLNLERRRTQCNIYVPEVYKIFTRDGVTFIVMEFIEGSRVWDFAKWFEAQYWEDHKSKYYDLIVEGIQLLRRMPDDEAPIEYRTVGELQDHLNKVAKFAYHNNPHPPTVNLEKELVFCYTDFDDENFMFTTSAHGRLRLYIVDFELASFLPIDFFAYTVLVPTSPAGS